MTIHGEPNEREPLLQVENGHTNGRLKNPGPMEISRSTRHGILAGIWVATFLTVSHDPPLVGSLGTTISTIYPFY